MKLYIIGILSIVALFVIVAFAGVIITTKAINELYSD